MGGPWLGPPCQSAALEDGLTLLDEGAGRLAVILCQSRARVVPRLEVQRLAERAALRGVHVALHVAKGDARAARQPARERAGLLLEVGVGDDAVHEAQPERRRR